MADFRNLTGILVVDDDPMMLELLTVRLDLAGYEAHGVSRRHAGHERFRRAAATSRDREGRGLAGHGPDR